MSWINKLFGREEKKEVYEDSICRLCKEKEKTEETYLCETCPIFADKNNDFELDIGIEMCYQCRGFMNSPYRLIGDFYNPKVKIQKQKLEMERDYILEALKKGIISIKDFVIIRDNFVKSIDKYIKRKEKEYIIKKGIKFENSLKNIKERYLK